MTVLRKGSSEEAGFDPARVALIRERAAEWVTQGRTPQVVLVLARRGVVALHDAFGEPGVDFSDVDGVFEVMSNSKPITATCVMRLVEDGLVGLNRPVMEYLPEMQGYGREEILVRHLLTHTSGYDGDSLIQTYSVVARGGDLPPMEENQNPFLHRVINAFFTLRPTRPPGEEMAYCNENYTLLGEIVRRVSGQPLDEYAREHIFEPLGMSDTSYRLLPHLEPRIVRAPTDIDAAVPMENPELRDAPRGGSGVRATALDYAKFCQAFLNRGAYGDYQMLRSRTVFEMTRNQIPGIGTDFGGWHPEASWGLGFRVMADEKWRWFDGSMLPQGSLMHGGNGGTNFWIDPENDMLGIYFSTCLDQDMDRGELHMDLDLFQNMAIAAIRD